MNRIDQSIPLAGLENTLEATLELLNNTRRSLHFYTPYLEPRVYNHNDVLDALRTRVTEQSRLNCFLLLPAASHWRRSCPHLYRLIEHLSSALRVRVLPASEPRERPEFHQSFMIADETLLLQHSDPQRLSGRYETQAAYRARVLLGFFMEIWEKSTADPELRRLGI